MSVAANESVIVRRGFCHVVGDNIPLDDGIMAFRYAIERISDPNVLIPHLFEMVDPEFAKRVRPGDIVLAGENFGCGKPHIQGFLAMAALQMGVVCASIPHKALRRAVAAGLPVLSGIADRERFAQSGDEIEVDYTTGLVRNRSRETEVRLQPMAPILREIVLRGGADGALAAWLAEHPEQRLVATT
jgi:3-isopropylmalate/(R)-2-methylmalate dehydratase small subunit